MKQKASAAAVGGFSSRNGLRGQRDSGVGCAVPLDKGDRRGCWGALQHCQGDGTNTRTEGDGRVLLSANAVQTLPKPRQFSTTLLIYLTFCSNPFGGTPSLGAAQEERGVQFCVQVRPSSGSVGWEGEDEGRARQQLRALERRGHGQVGTRGRLLSSTLPVRDTSQGHCPAPGNGLSPGIPFPAC